GGFGHRARDRITDVSTSPSCPARGSLQPPLRRGPMDIPYGRSNFEEIRRKGYFYVDKTPFLPLLERGHVGYPLFLRPRRFGTATLVSMLEDYYDISRKDQADELFKGLWVHEHPTPERSSYVVLTLDFSGVATDGGPEVLRRTFFESVRSSVRAFLLRYRD